VGEFIYLFDLFDLVPVRSLARRGFAHLPIYLFIFRISSRHGTAAGHRFAHLTIIFIYLPVQFAARHCGTAPLRLVDNLIYLFPSSVRASMQTSAAPLACWAEQIYFLFST